MMFFLARSALCIGLVAAAASGVGTRPLATAVDRGVRDAVTGAGRACLESEECLAAGTAVLSSAAVRASGAPSPRRPEARASRTASPPGG